MGKLRVFSGKQMCKLLEQHGFVNVRQRGSHVVMQKKTESSTITVPVPYSPDHTDWYASVDNPAVKTTSRVIRSIGVKNESV